MTTAVEVKDITDFTDTEIKDEYIERFGDPDDWDVDEISDSDLSDEYEKRFGTDEPEAPDGFDEIIDLIAEAALTSDPAKRAYQLLRDAYPTEMRTLDAHQRIIAGRKEGVAA